MSAEPIRILAPSAFAPALDAMAAALKILSLSWHYGPATGPSESSVTSQLRAGAEAQFAILPQGLAAAELEAGRLVKLHPFAYSPIAFCVNIRSNVPDLSTAEALKAFLMAAPSIGISPAGSGVFFRDHLLSRLAVGPSISDKISEISDQPIGRAVAQGRVAVGFQQKAELLQEEGIVLVDGLPEVARNDTLLVLCEVEGASANADRLVAALASQAIRESLSRHGLNAC